MKKQTAFFILTLFFCTQNLSAQDVGAGAVASRETGSSNTWKNWVFASTALISVVIGVVVISLNPGSNSH